MPLIGDFFSIAGVLFADFGEKGYFCNVIGFERHIEILLLDNDCVIVPELGGFMAHPVEARYDSTDDVMLPPYRTLGFNPKLRLNDSLLAQSYIEAYDISYPEAMERIAGEVNELKQRLQNDGSYELNNLGTISLNADGKYVFNPNEAGILTPELYGLSSVEIAPLKEKSTVSTTVEVKTRAVDPVNTIEAKPKLVANESTTETIFSEESTEKATMHTLIWNVVAVAAVVLAFFLISPPLGNNTPRGMVKSEINTDLLHKIMPKEVEKRTITKLQKAPASAKPITIKTEQQAEKKKIETYFCLVLASHVTVKNAQSYVNEIKKAGFDKASVLENKGATKVIYGQYSSENEAYNALNSLHSNNYFKSAWVLYVK